MDYYKDIIIIKKGKCFSKLNENLIITYLFLQNLI